MGGCLETEITIRPDGSGLRVDTVTLSRETVRKLDRKFPLEVLTEEYMKDRMAAEWPGVEVKSFKTWWIPGPGGVGRGAQVWQLVSEFKRLEAFGGPEASFWGEGREAGRRNFRFTHQVESGFWTVVGGRGGKAKGLKRYSAEVKGARAGLRVHFPGKVVKVSKEAKATEGNTVMWDLPWEKVSGEGVLVEAVVAVPGKEF